METKRAVIFANGQLTDANQVLAQIRPDDVLIAADGGLHHLQALGLSPHVLIGDFDSISEDEVEVARSNGATVLSYPREKDETDLELAIKYTIDQGCTTLRIIAALGGRLDHTLANLFLLEMPALQDLDVRIDDGHEEIFIIKRPLTIAGQAGDTLSLLALETCARGVYTQGLKYPLREETLCPHLSRGVSNEMIEDEARVSLHSGRLLCIHTRQTKR